MTGNEVPLSTWPAPGDGGQRDGGEGACKERR